MATSARHVDGHAIEQQFKELLDGKTFGQFRVRVELAEVFSVMDKQGIDALLSIEQLVTAATYSVPLQLKSGPTGLQEWRADYRFRVLGRAFGVIVTPKDLAKGAEHVFQSVLMQCVRQLEDMPGSAEPRKELRRLMADLGI